MMSKKIRICDTYKIIYPHAGIRSNINALQEAEALEASGEWTDMQLEHICTDDYDSPEWHIKGYRWETDKEYEQRMKHLAQAAAIKKKVKVEQEENEKKLYEKLKKKYEGK
jgi:hypothetical protein